MLARRFLISTFFLSILGCSPPEQTPKPKPPVRSKPVIEKDRDVADKDRPGLIQAKPTVVPSPMPAAFDPHSHQRSNEWMIEQVLEMTKVQANAIAYKEAKATLDEKLASLAGKQVNWHLDVERVDGSPDPAVAKVRFLDVGHPHAASEHLQILTRASTTGQISRSDFPYIAMRVGPRSFYGGTDPVEMSVALAKKLLPGKPAAFVATIKKVEIHERHIRDTIPVLLQYDVHWILINFEMGKD